MKLANKVAVVTGASKGIGRATAVELARNGADVVVNYSSTTQLAEEVAAEIRSIGRKALCVRADVGDRGAVERMFDATVGEFGRVDILVNNAAFSIRKPFLDLDVADVERTWSVSLWGVFHCSQVAARQMVKRGEGGNIIVVSSVHAWRPYQTATAYNAAKAAANQMAYTWASELARHRIRVNVLEPGWTDTPGERNFNSEEQLRTGGRLVPLGRLATAEEIAKGVLFLASDEDSSYMTGGCVPMDGGFSLIH